MIKPIKNTSVTLRRKFAASAVKVERPIIIAEVAKVYAEEEEKGLAARVAACA